jgi:HEAT repeat protein
MTPMDEKTNESASTVNETPPQAPKKRFDIKSLILLVACCGAFFWAYTRIREELKPNADLVRLLQSSDVAEREDAARKLGAVDPEYVPKAVKLLIGAQSDSDERVRAIAVWSLGNSVVAALKVENKEISREAAQALFQALGDEAAEVRASSAESFTQIAKVTKADTFPSEVAPVVSKLAGLLNDGSDRVRRGGRNALSAFAASMAIEPPSALLDELVHAKLPETRAEAALTLGSFKAGAESTVKALTIALKDTEPLVRSSAAVAIRMFNAGGLPALSNLIVVLDDPYVPPAPPAPPSGPLTPVTPQTRSAGGGGGNSQSAATDPATEAVKTIGPLLEAQIAKGETPPAEALAGLLKSLKSTRPTLRDAAIQVFQRIRKGASAIAPDLIRELTESIPNPNSVFGPIAAATLGDIGPGSPMASDAIAALTSALDAKTSATRANAVEAIGRFGPAASSARSRLKEVAEADKDLTATVKTAIDRIEGKIPPDTPRRRGGRGGRGGGGGGGGGRGGRGG